METRMENVLRNIDPKNATQALETVKPDLMKIPERQLEPIRTDVMRAVSVVLTVRPNIMEDKPRFQKHFNDFPMENIDRLETYAMAMWHAENEYRRRQVEEDIRRNPPVELVERCKDLRDEMMAGIHYFYRRDPRVRDLINDMRHSTDYRDLADDLHRLTDLFNTHWNRVENRTHVTREMVDQANDFSTKLTNFINTNEPQNLKPFVELRLRAWNMLQRTYNEIREGARYIYRHEPEKMVNYPHINCTTRCGMHRDEKKR
jgi:hypothetical protein